MKGRGRSSGSSGNGKPKSNKFKDFAFWFKTIGFAALCALIFTALWLYVSPLLKRDTTLPEKLTIGVLVDNKAKEEPNYKELADYLSSNSKSKFVVDAIEITNENALEEAEKKLAEQEWDIAFTKEPFTSIAAINSRYLFIARLSQPNITNRAAIIVKKDSGINSIEDISKDTKIAIGEPNAGALYYMPIYDLYGAKGFTGVSQKSPFESLTALEKNEVKAATVFYGSSFPKPDGTLVDLTPEINDGKKYRAISLSRQILSGSVYISSKLNKEKKFLEKLLLDAPTEIRKKSNYEIEQREEDYSFFRSVQNRVKTILACDDKKGSTSNEYDLSPKLCPENVSGIISGVRLLNTNKVELVVKNDRSDRRREETGSQPPNTPTGSQPKSDPSDPQPRRGRTGTGTEYGVLLSQNDLLKKLSVDFKVKDQDSLDTLYSNLDSIRVRISKVSPTEFKGGMTYFDFTKNETDKARIEFLKRGRPR